MNVVHTNDKGFLPGLTFLSVTASFEESAMGLSCLLSLDVEST
ncbi:hypothetical protein [Candidatus Poriferisocius sp.]